MFIRLIVKTHPIVAYVLKALLAYINNSYTLFMFEMGHFHTSWYEAQCITNIVACVLGHPQSIQKMQILLY